MRGSKVIVSTTRPERLKKEGLPTTLTLDLEIHPEKIGPMLRTKWRDKWKYITYEYPFEICRWFSVAVEREVKVLRAGFNYTNDIKKQFQPFRKDDDAMKGFYRGA